MKTFERPTLQPKSNHLLHGMEESVAGGFFKHVPELLDEIEIRAIYQALRTQPSLSSPSATFDMSSNKKGGVTF